MFSLHHYINADDLSRALNSADIDLGVFGLSVIWSQLCDSLIGAGRVGAEHLFLTAGQVQDSRLTAPAEACGDYVAACIADFLHEELLACRQSFAFETVMSHHSKVEIFARARSEGPPHHTRAQRSCSTNKEPLDRLMTSIEGISQGYRWLTFSLG